jgi:hypothetical protein
MNAPTAAPAAVVVENTDDEFRTCVEERIPDPDDALGMTWDNFQAARARFFAGVSGRESAG